MILGVGVDLVSIERIGKVYQKFPERFPERIFTAREKKSFKARGARSHPMAALAARFAAKEAVLKAIGCGIGPAALKEVEILTSPGRRPQVMLHGEAFRLAGERNIADVLISMTHEATMACAFAVALKAPAGNGLAIPRP